MIVKPSFLLFSHSFFGLAQIAFKQRRDRNAVERGQPTVTIQSVVHTDILESLLS